MYSTLGYSPDIHEADEGQSFISSFKANMNEVDAAIASLESLDNQITQLVELSVSNESLSGSLLDLMRKAVDYLLQLWDRFTDAIADLARSTAFLRVRLTYARSYLNDIEGRNPRLMKLEVSNYIRQVSNDRTPALDARLLLENLNILERQVALIRKQYLPMVTAIGKNYTAAFSNWGRLSANDWLREINVVGSSFRPLTALNITEAFTSYASTEYKEGSKMSRPLPGRKVLIVTEPENANIAGTATEVERAAVYRSASVVLAELRSDDKFDGKIEQNVLGQRQIGALLDGVERIIKEMDVSALDNTRRTVRELGYSMDRLNKSNLVVGDGEVAIFRAGLSYANTIARWLREPYFGMLTHSASVCNSMIRLCNYHSKSYLKPEKTKDTP